MCNLRNDLLVYLVDYFKDWIKGDGDYCSESEDNQVTEVTYRLYALDLTNITKTVNAFDNLCREETQKHIFDSEEDQRIIANLKPENVCLS